MVIIQLLLLLPLLLITTARCHWIRPEIELMMLLMIKMMIAAAVARVAAARTYLIVPIPASRLNCINIAHTGGHLLLEATRAENFIIDESRRPLASALHLIELGI